MSNGVLKSELIYPSLIIDSYLGDWSGRPPRPKQRVGSDRPWHKESHDMRDSVWGGLWRPGEAFFQIGLDCVMSHHHIEGLCTFLFKFWRENSKWSSFPAACAAGNDFMQVWMILCYRECFCKTNAFYKNAPLAR